MAILGFAGRWPESIDVQAQAIHVQTGLADAHSTVVHTDPAGSWRTVVAARAVFRAQGVTVAVEGRPIWSFPGTCPCRREPGGANTRGLPEAGPKHPCRSSGNLRARDSR